MRSLHRHPAGLRPQISSRAAFARRKGEHGSAIIETFMSMVMLGLILFGILQLFQLALADMVTDYAAFRGARSSAVGFRDEYAYREALIKTAPVSGPMISPKKEIYSGYGQGGSIETEKSLLKGYMEGERNVKYAYWTTENVYHTNYKCPNYGKPLEGTCPNCKIPGCGCRVTQGYVQGYDQTTEFEFEFNYYPLNLPLNDLFTSCSSCCGGRNYIRIAGKAELANHSSAYLE